VGIIYFMRNTPLTDDEKRAKKKERWKKIFDNYPTYDDSKGRGNPEVWRQAVEKMLKGKTTHSDLEHFDLTSLPKTLDELKKIWKQKMRKAHPDHGGDTAQAQAINDAYKNLKKRYVNNTVVSSTKIPDQFHPAKAEHIEHADFAKLWIDKKYINDDYIVEKKLDGSRYLLYIDEYSKLLSRRISSVTKQYVDKTGNCPHLTKPIHYSFWGTILDGEVTHPLYEKSDATTSIMGCDASTAIQKQQKDGWLIYTVYDILKYKGIDLRLEPLTVRKEKLKLFLKELGALLPIVEHPSYPSSYAETLYNDVISKDGEGVMLKDKRAVYGNGWLKVKKTITSDVFIIGYKKTKNYTVKFGMYDQHGKIIELGSVPVPPTVLNEILKDKDSYLMKVIEIRAQEITKSGAFRHPRFIKFREDKDASQCVENFC
jgi:ATP-dependent DNA ligase